jgi:hypothetical protein
MLGLLKVKETSMWGKENQSILTYTASNALVNQVFLKSGSTLLTNHRLIELYQIRPIDNLFMLIAELNRAKPN